MSSLYEGSNVDTDSCFSSLEDQRDHICFNGTQSAARSAINGPDIPAITIKREMVEPSHITVEYKRRAFTIEHPVQGNGFERYPSSTSAACIRGQT
ncbi:hypothetical protein OK016_26725 [Vibrio chagasii]|nr:hypothetical protein [Vibrio chagasii]